MNSFNLLSISNNFIDFAVDKITSIELNWIGKVIQWLIEGVGIIGLGIVLFTLILKTLVLPLDVFSRYKMKKQSLLMKAMRPQMERLQKQYANDKQMYNQKVMELQKANGISMLGTCLPTLISLFIFIFVFNAFSTYSQFANLNTYNDMVYSYNASVYQYVLTDTNSDGFLIGEYDQTLNTADENVLTIIVGGQEKKVNTYKVDFDKYKAVANVGSEFDALKESDKMDVVRNYVREGARRAAAQYYRDVKSNKYKGEEESKKLSNKFLWVKNLWYPDSPFNKEVPEYSKFISAISRAAGATDATYEESYNEVTYYLSNDGFADGKLEGKRVNGYFVLIVLAIGLMFLQQFISMRSQKDSNDLSTVDGSGARTNKVMLIAMPIMYGLFSFFYSAAFSIYMITNTVYSLITTVIINKIMDVSFAKKEASGELFAKKDGRNNRKRLK